MLRKEEIVIGTKKEIEGYYKGLELKSRDQMYPPGISVNCEFKPLEDQLKDVTEKGFGIICWFRAEFKPYNKEKPHPQMKLTIERKFIWVVPENSNEPVG